MFNNESVNIDGKQLAYVRFNEWSNDVILFFHGFTGSKEYFPKTQVKNKCILSFDRPGVGESSVVEYYSMENFLTNVYEVLKSHNVTSVKIVGHSAGGYYAQLFAQMYPEIVKSLSLISSMVPLNCPKTKKIVNGQWKFISFLSLKAKKVSQFYFNQMAKSIKKDYEKQLVKNMRSLPEIEKNFIEENPQMIKNSILNAVANEGLGVCYDAYALCQKREEVKISPNIPVYIWHGTEDTTTPISFVEYFESEYAVKQVHKLEQVGHMLYLPYWGEIIEEIV
ncbi:MAG: alpha/beta hydrolase [Oscillospiraceae bacterium]|nr:alpha/beta hydrolase [Oscillospiraceae bacterium]MDE7170258.1 alpha/beta hydrolase [Oscillospiraceae bacterium]